MKEISVWPLAYPFGEIVDKTDAWVGIILSRAQLKEIIDES